MFVSESHKVTPGILCLALERIRDELIEWSKAGGTWFENICQGLSSIYWTNKKIKDRCAMKPLPTWEMDMWYVWSVGEKHVCQCLEARSDQGNFKH